ncbi:MAG: protein translocase subunit SecD [Syntrophales bacterium]|jgi:preprotein translocase subunit SecD|nr:protein translocase subunit SecD [Syntrophales bacterium]MCK9527141.1 protein translocase subunit SecD [Syntrophales bacterium]MDX9921734.1 protein translocase subunit SecD [Syntrophales bacterium]
MFDKNIRLRIVIAVVVSLVAIFYMMPSLTDRLPAFWKNNLPSEAVRLGLDLQGGMHLILEVQTDRAVESSLERMGGNLKDALMGERVRFRELESRDADAMVFALPDEDSARRFKIILTDQFPTLKIDSSQIADGVERVTLKVDAQQVEAIKKFALEQSLETIRNRVDQFGVTEPQIIPQGRDRILIQFPGIDDPLRAINLIGKTALLEFKLVNDEFSLDEALRGAVPPGNEILYGTGVDRVSGARTRTPYLLYSRALLTGDALEDARVAIEGRFGAPYVSIKFDTQGARDFERITAQHVRKRLAIVLDGVVHSAPVIQERISGGQAQITGDFSMEDARDLAIVLRAGALPAPVVILEQRRVGPSLGQDSIDKGFLSVVVGTLLVLALMIVYYNYSGIIAVVALLMNFILIFGALAAFKATLTLPGVAGIVLIIGMAVDANVLIFERIREELRLGKSPRAAVKAGYGKALLTIVDANVTTLIAALVLFQFGTGPVRGFAVTLSLGIICSMFTAIFVTRIIFDYFIWYRKVQRVSI